MSPRQLTTHTDGLTIQPQLKLELELSFTLFKICCIELGSVQKNYLREIFTKGYPSCCCEELYNPVITVMNI